MTYEVMNTFLPIWGISLLTTIDIPLCMHRLLGSSFLTRVAQVLVVAFRKKNASFGSSGFIGLYEVPGRQPPIKGSRKITHVDEVAVSS